MVGHVIHGTQRRQGAVGGWNVFYQVHSSEEKHDSQKKKNLHFKCSFCIFIWMMKVPLALLAGHKQKITTQTLWETTRSRIPYCNTSGTLYRPCTHIYTAECSWKKKKVIWLSYLFVLLYMVFTCWLLFTCTLDWWLLFARHLKSKCFF